MGLMLTPGGMRRFGEFYCQLSSLLNAGVTLIEALRVVQQSPPHRSLVRPLQRIGADLQTGYTLGEAVQRQGNWLPAFDVALIQAGEQTGRLDASLRQLGNHYIQHARLIQAAMASLAYPVFLVHMAILIFPPGMITRMFWQGAYREYIAAKLMILVPLYLAGLVLILLSQARRGERVRAAFERLLRPVPMLGKARHSLALARFAGALEASIMAGMSVTQAWEQAGGVSGSPRLRRAVAQAIPRISGGMPPGEVMAGLPVFPPAFVSVFRTGELSGKLDQSLGQLRQLFEDDAARKITAFAEWLPRIIYLAIAAILGYAIVSFWIQYYSNLSELPAGF
ncbi:MAG: type II secretion system F family protein [Verrucomicrobia bacterium]|nr:type II secretion system F family protein [Verrucomicrobiota bacterium]